jgi:hypothetical protein
MEIVKEKIGIKKIKARCGGMCLWSQLLGRLKQENFLNPRV